MSTPASDHADVDTMQVPLPWVRTRRRALGPVGSSTIDLIGMALAAAGAPSRQVPSAIWAKL